MIKVCLLRRRNLEAKKLTKIWHCRSSYILTSHYCLHSHFLPSLQDIQHLFPCLLRRSPTLTLPPFCFFFFSERSAEVFDSCLLRLLVFFLEKRKKCFTYYFMCMNGSPACALSAWLVLPVARRRCKIPWNKL